MACCQRRRDKYHHHLLGRWIVDAKVSSNSAPPNILVDINSIAVLLSSAMNEVQFVVLDLLLHRLIL